MKKDEAKKALEQLNIPEQKTKRSTRVEHDYAALSATTFKNKKVEQIIPETPVATIKKAESKPKIKKVVENIITPEQTITREPQRQSTRAKKIDYAALSATTFRTKK
jgi:hypothetical protein